LYFWCKGELYDLESLKTCIANYDGVVKKDKQLKGVLEKNEKELNDAQMGRKSVKTVLTGNNAAQIPISIQKNKEDMNINDKLLLIQLAYLGESIIPQFRKEKLRLYQAIFQ